MRQGYMKAEKRASIAAPKKASPHFTTFEINGVRVYLGKNNLQNEYLTRTLARKTTCGFSRKSYHGAHVICTDPSRKNLLRTCAHAGNLLFQGPLFQRRTGRLLCHPSVEESARFKTGMVTMQSYRTIYIDPDAKAIAALHADHQIRK
ncbi:MAG: hypothetical protein ACLVJ6_12085 [Merdibacter sp.]